MPQRRVCRTPQRNLHGDDYICAAGMARDLFATERHWWPPCGQIRSEICQATVGVEVFDVSTSHVAACCYAVNGGASCSPLYVPCAALAFSAWECVGCHWGGGGGKSNWVLCYLKALGRRPAEERVCGRRARYQVALRQADCARGAVTLPMAGEAGQLTAGEGDGPGRKGVGQPVGDGADVRAAGDEDEVPSGTPWGIVVPPSPLDRPPPGGASAVPTPRSFGRHTSAPRGTASRWSP